MTYIKEGDDIFKVTERREKIDLQALKDRLKALEEMTEPTDQELIEWGKTIHSYYEGREKLIKVLAKEIVIIELAIKSPEKGF